ATEDYSLARRLFLYVRANSENPYMRDFIEFALSFKGQEVVAQTGFVDMTIRFFPSNPELKSVLRDPNVRKQYANLIQEGKRLSTNFRFHPADARLDNRGVKDLERLVEFLKNNLDKKIVLVGFTDSAGDYEFNQKLALERAKSVGKELSARGLVVAEVIGVGQERNIASNETESGRAKNRRVEVWIY
ncbi:MAG: cell envelope biogenesis protein OmpA, partial [Desulfobacteraceae bacterium]